MNATKDSIEELAAEVLRTRQAYESICLRNVAEQHDAQVQQIIERQRAVHTMVAAEMALSSAVRKEMA